MNAYMLSEAAADLYVALNNAATNASDVENFTQEEFKLKGEIELARNWMLILGTTSQLSADKTYTEEEFRERIAMALGRYAHIKGLQTDPAAPEVLKKMQYENFASDIASTEQSIRSQLTLLIRKLPRAEEHPEERANILQSLHIPANLLKDLPLSEEEKKKLTTISSEKSQDQRSQEILNSQTDILKGNMKPADQEPVEKADTQKMQEGEPVSDEKLMSDIAEKTQFMPYYGKLSRSLEGAAEVVAKRLLDSDMLSIRPKEGRIDTAYIGSPKTQMPEEVAGVLRAATGKDLTPQSAEQLYADVQKALEKVATQNEKLVGDIIEKTDFFLSYNGRLGHPLRGAAGVTAAQLSGSQFFTIQQKEGKISAAYLGSPETKIPEEVASVLHAAIGKDLSKESAEQLLADVQKALEEYAKKNPN